MGCKMIKRLLFLFLIIVSPSIIKSYAQTTRHVPAQYSTIQAAINASVNGDTILVAPGIYQEFLNYNGKNIVLGSYFLTSNDTSYISQTIIDGNNSGITVTFTNGCTLDAELIGFTIKRGWTGIRISSASATLKNLIITENSLGYPGATAFYATTDGKPVIIDNCIFENNISSSNKPTFYCLINFDLNQGLKINNSIFRNNSGTVSLDGSPALISNSIICNNQNGLRIGYYWDFQSRTRIVQSTIANNGSPQIYFANTKAELYNSIVWGGANPQIVDASSSQPSQLYIKNNLIKNARDGLDIQPTTFLEWGNNNFSASPEFVDTTSDNYQLTQFSPAIAQGDTTYSTPQDIIGNPRPNPTGSNPDLGAYESPLAHFKLLPPILSSVPNGAINQLTNIQLKWNPVYAATSYRFQFSTDSTFQTTLVDQANVVDTFYNLSSLDYLTKYYWRVNATYPYDTSDWSDVWNFTTIIEAPETPILVTPVNSSFNHTTDLSFNWDSSLRADKYEFQLATDTLFQNIVVIDTSITGTSRVVTGLSYNTNYFWRVRAKNVGGNSSFSTIWNFRTKLQTPTLQSPANNSQNITINPTLTWSTVAGAANYHLQVALDPLFNQIILNDSLLTNTSVQVGPLLNSTAYYWRVKGYNGIYKSDFSGSFNFTTIISNPNFPVLLSPGNGSVNQPLNITFTWEPVASATSYKLQVSTDSLFGSFIINDSSITTTSKFVNLPNSNQKYFWRVQAKNVGGNSPFSSEWYLITVLPAPSLTSINAGNKTVQFNWNQLPLSNLLQNNIYRDETPNPAQLVASIPFNQTSFTDTGLTNGVTYYYRVKTVSVYGVESEYSNQLSAAPHNSSPVAAVLNPVIFPNDGRVLTREVSFNNAGSFDPDGSIDSSKWYVNNEFISYGNSLTYPFPQGTHSVKLVVIDNDGESDTSSTHVTRSMFTKNVNGQVVAGLSLIGSNILYAIVNGDAIYRMDKDGNIDYTIQVGGNLLSSSSIANDSTVYIGSTDNNIYAFSKNGTSLWVRPLGGAVTTTPTIDILNDRVYVGVSNRNFQFLDRSNGSVLGNYFSDSPINTSAVITTDNRLFFSTVKGTMYGFDLASISFPNVVPTWTITSSDTISSSPAIDAEGFFYVGTKNGLLKKISMQSGLQGTVVWQTNLGGTITASPVIDASGNIYVGSTNNNFFAVDRENGSIKWSYPFGGPIKTTAAISGNAKIYFGTSNGYIYCVDTLGTALWQYKDSSSICTSLLYSDGVLYLGTLDGRLVALYDQAVTESSTLLANNIWGTFQGNNQRTGEQADRLTSIKEGNFSSVPTEYIVFDNFPNPFNPSTIIRYALPYQSKVKIEVYNIIGELVKDLVDLEQAPGFYDITFDASGLSSGIYTYRIVALSMDNKNQFSKVKKMILLK